MRKSIIGLVFLFALQACAQDFKKSYTIIPSPPFDPSHMWRGGPMPPGRNNMPPPPPVKQGPFFDINVEIKDLKGTLRVEGYTGNTIEVIIKKKGPQSKQIEINDKSSDKLDINITFPVLETNHSNSVDCEIRVPNDKWYTYDFNSSNGNIEVSKLFGRIFLRTIGGSIGIKDVSGGLNAFSMKGHAKVELSADSGQKVPFATGIMVRCGSGNVDVIAPSDLDAAIRVSSGVGALKSAFPIQLDDIRYGPKKVGNVILGAGKQKLNFESDYGQVTLIKK